MLTLFESYLLGSMGVATIALFLFYCWKAS